MSLRKKIKYQKTKKRMIKKNITNKKTSRNSKTNSKSNKRNLYKKKTTKKINKKKISSKQRSKLVNKKNISKKKSLKKIIKENKLTKDNIKSSIKFDSLLKNIVTKLINKNKINGIYTKTKIEKGIPKKFRIPENVAKVENFLNKNNITILSEEEAKKRENKIVELTKEESNKDEKKQTGKTDDPVRLYLRDMGSVELLSREGEIAIAKRIEAGREKMIGAICESPLTIRSIINWKESIKEGTMLLRDIVDLEQTYDMTDFNTAKIEDTLQIIKSSTKKKEQVIKTIKDEKKIENNNLDSGIKEGEEDSEEKEDNEEDSLNVSLAAMEEELKPKVLKDFDEITKQFKKLQKHSQDLASTKQNDKKYFSKEKKYNKIKKEIVASMKAVHFNSLTIEALMESLYELNKKLLFREGKMLRMAMESGVSRESFIENYLTFDFKKIKIGISLLTNIIL